MDQRDFFFLKEKKNNWDKKKYLNICPFNLRVRRWLTLLCHLNPAEAQPMAHASHY